MSYDFGALFEDNLAATVDSHIGIQGFFDVYRPNYADALTTETKLTTDPVPMRVDSDSSAYSKTKMAGLQYFGLYFNRRNPAVKAGYILIENPVSDTPPVLVTEVQKNMQSVGVRLGEMGEIYASRKITDPIYKNVRFNYASLLPPGPPIEPSEEGSFDTEQRRIVTWKRPEIKQGRFLKDSTTGRFYFILEVQTDGNIVTCYMEDARKK